MTVLNIIGIAITLVFLVAFYPALSDIINSVSGVDDTTKMVLNFLPLAIAIAVILLPFWYSAPQYIEGRR